MSKSKTVSVNMTPEAYDKLKQLAKENKRTMSGQMNWLLIQILREMEKDPDCLKDPSAWNLRH